MPNKGPIEQRSDRGFRIIMARWLTVLIALVAQGMALVSPVCLVRCVSPNGHECVELVGQDCHCCGCLANELSPQVCTVAACCDRCHDDDEEQEVPVGPQITGQDCSCQHSPLVSAPQVPSNSLVTGELSQTLDFVTTLDFVVVVRILENVSFQRSLLRPQESPQLAALATVVLRV